jgi:hypothetical protein
MPIPVAQLQQAKAPLRERVMEFLKANASEAYSVAEIYVALEGYDSRAGGIMVALLGGPQRRVFFEPLTTLHEAEQLRGLMRQKCREVERYAAIPRDKDDSCRCATPDACTLPAHVAEPCGDAP